MQMKVGTLKKCKRFMMKYNPRIFYIVLSLRGALAISHVKVRDKLSNLLKNIGLEPIVLHRQPDEGLTIIEKLEKFLMF